jgi:hypothetical protein
MHSVGSLEKINDIHTYIGTFRGIVQMFSSNDYIHGGRTFGHECTMKTMSLKVCLHSPTGIK